MPARTSSSSYGLPVYRVLRSDRAATDGLQPGTLLYPGRDAYGCASDDTRLNCIHYVACSRSPTGLPFFTIPSADIELIGHIQEPDLNAGSPPPAPQPQHAPGEYSVCQFFANGTHEYVGRWMAAQPAMNLALRFASSVGAQVGTTTCVIITDGGGSVNWEWQFGKGVTFPKLAS